MSHHGHLWHGSETLHGNHPMRDTIGWHDGDTRRGRYWDQTRVVDVSLEKGKKIVKFGKLHSSEVRWCWLFAALTEALELALFLP